MTESYEVLTYALWAKVMAPPKRRSKELDEGIQKTLQSLKEKAEAG